MNWQQFLTEKVLGECYHEGSSLLNSGYHCRKCDKAFSVNRTFNNRNDLMDLYQKIYEDGKWDDFFWDFAFKRKPENYGLGEAETSVWLFCLNGEDYEERCKMVAEFYGWNEQRDPVIDKNSGAYGDN